MVVRKRKQLLKRPEHLGEVLNGLLRLGNENVDLLRHFEKSLNKTLENKLLQHKIDGFVSACEP